MFDGKLKALKSLLLDFWLLAFGFWYNYNVLVQPQPLLSCVLEYGCEFLHLSVHIDSRYEYDTHPKAETSKITV